MNITQLRRAVAVVLIALVAGAAWLMPRHPIVASALLALVAGVGLTQWRAHAASRRIALAGLRCDVGALKELAERGSVLGRVAASMAFIHHGGESTGSPLCTCGECELDTIGLELEKVRRIVRLSWSGFGTKAYELASSQELIDEKISPTLRGAVTQLRIPTRLIGYAAAAAEERTSEARPEWFALALAYVETNLPSVLWPARLAAAREAAARSDFAAAKKHLEGMPAWPEGSPLEAVRRDLSAT